MSTTKSNIRKRERQQERFEQRKIEAEHPPLKLPRIGFTGELIEHIQKRSLASIIAEVEQEEK